ncbi:periplasmic heavy metal sensor [Allochromatium humboldtianum]|uniref:Signaling pathway modulator ZraP n=1 Tax=Allochromatium humboldtianum TaxID=504901 RepID=A0A850R1G4_9GAMM|nr:periplasmic heavy metal sensor [Allochromatium humboldtianum]NVZ08459.1 periplasmic heavy metal sensor [Allochromatium humboldtianum]
MNSQSTHSRFTRTSAALGLILGAALIGATTAQAGPGMGGHGGPDMDVGAKVEYMTKQLDLTAEQQEQVRAILEKTRQEQMRLRQENRAQIDALLTEEQKAKRTERQLKAVNRQVERLTDQLDLTDEQAGQLKALFTEQRQSRALTRAQMHERMAAILTAEQLAELDEGRGRRGGYGQGRGDCPGY